VLFLPLRPSEVRRTSGGLVSPTNFSASRWLHRTGTGLGRTSSGLGQFRRIRRSSDGLSGWVRRNWLGPSKSVALRRKTRGSVKYTLPWVLLVEAVLKRLILSYCRSVKLILGVPQYMGLYTYRSATDHLYIFVHVMWIPCQHSPSSSAEIVKKDWGIKSDLREIPFIARSFEYYKRPTKISSNNKWHWYSHIFWALKFVISNKMTIQSQKLNSRHSVGQSISHILVCVNSLLSG